MPKQNDLIKEVLDLRSHESIAVAIADRQLAVITKAYEFLSQPKNRIIYIADEVGLGKTYIGLGIAALLRHYSRDPARHLDLMIVPKKNLQDKWLKELRNFAQRNYIKGGPYFKQATLANTVIGDRLRPVSPTALFTILRMTSFSSLITSRNGLHAYFEQQVFGGDTFCREVLWKAYHLQYFNQENRGLLLRLAACLLNAVSAPVDCLIVDEAHNYKYGPGEDGSGAARNQVTARFLGAIRDKEIIRKFPEVHKQMKYPLAKKVICLSATPKDRHLLEIKNQLDCFTNKNPLKNISESDEIKDLLPTFLIRGNMEYHLGNNIYSRNQCRYEHRSGNVEKTPNAPPITLGNDLDNVFWQLLQYKSIRHLSQKANASFEIGMLAGFESYQLDMDKRVAAATDDEGNTSADKEYEIIKSRNQKASEDGNVIRELINSYKDTFGNEPPPHPKLSKLETELLSQFSQQEKSLIFVRRIATVDELLRHLLQRFDQELVNNQYLNFQGKWKRFLTKEVIALRKACHHFYTDQKRLQALDRLSEVSALVKWAGKMIMPSEMDLTDLLRFCYYQGMASLVALLDDYLLNDRFSRSRSATAISDIKIAFPNWRAQVNSIEPDIPSEEETELRMDSFFKNYFKKKQDGFRFRQKIYRENWFDLNYYLLLSADETWKDKTVNARNGLANFLPSLEGRRQHNVFNDYQIAFCASLLQSSTMPSKLPVHRSANPLLSNTFLTQLLLSACTTEWAAWKSKRLGSSIEDLLADMAALNGLLQSVFQHSSGLLPAFVAESRNGDFTRNLISLIKTPDSPFHFVLEEVKIILRDFNLIIAVNFQDRDPKKIADLLKNRSPIVGASGQDKNRSAIAARFRMPGFPYALIATDIFHEGEDLHTYCQAVYHYGIAWNPSSIEQRTGRIDRINSLSYRKLTGSAELRFDNQVQVFYPYLTRSVEVNQVVKLLGHVNRFMEDFNDIDAVQRYDSEVQVAEAITEEDIPQAITRRIYSKYDVDNFKG